MSNNKLDSIIMELSKARQYLNSVRERFSSKPILLKFYEPSALDIVNKCEVKLKNRIKAETGMEITVIDSTNEVDLWLRFEGKDFSNGQGPINVIGSYLQRLNSACHSASKLIDETKNEQVSFEETSFNLVQTAKGSLRLGLKNPEYEVSKEACELFQENTWDKFKELVQKKERTQKALSLLLRTMFATSNEDELEQLRKELNDDNRLLRLLYYTKELAPSAQSQIDRVSFECKELIGRNEYANLTADKTTRKQINHYAKRFRQDKEYVKASGVIRALDVDQKKLTARPFSLKSINYHEVECKLPSSIRSGQFRQYVDKIVLMRGFLSRDAMGNPSRIDVDEIELQEDENDDD